MQCVPSAMFIPLEIYFVILLLLMTTLLYY